MRSPLKTWLERTLNYVPLVEKDVLEVGCGDGKLTFQYADMANRVVGIDPKGDEIEKAERSVPRRLHSKIQFHVGKGESLPIPEESFHVVLFTYSLCCISRANMKRALEESYRVLRSGGLLVELHPTSDSGHEGAYEALRYVTHNENLFDQISEGEFTDETHGNVLLTVLTKSRRR